MRWLYALFFVATTFVLFTNTVSSTSSSSSPSQFVSPTIVEDLTETIESEKLKANEELKMGADDWTFAHFPASPLSFVEMESHFTRQNLDDEYDENDPAEHRHSRHSKKVAKDEDNANQAEEVEEDQEDNESNRRHNSHQSSSHHTSHRHHSSYDNDRFQETRQQQQQQLQQNQHQTQQQQNQLLQFATEDPPAQQGQQGQQGGGDFGPCKTCVFVLERIKKGTNMLLPAICSEIYIHFPNAYAMCHQVLNALSLNGNNVRYWLFEGCYKYEIYQAKEWVKPCPSHVMCTVLKTLRNNPFCRPLPMENPFVNDQEEGGSDAGGANAGGANPGGANPGGANPGGANPGGATPPAGA